MMTKTEGECPNSIGDHGGSGSGNGPKPGLGPKSKGETFPRSKAEGDENSRESPRKVT